jgi:hypothetical protein
MEDLYHEDKDTLFGDPLAPQGNSGRRVDPLLASRNDKNFIESWQ